MLTTSCHRSSCETSVHVRAPDELDRRTKKMFQPPRCPNRECSQHTAPRPGFCFKRGSYHPKCRPRPVPRFECRTCRRSFSRQTFRSDYRDHRPDLNARLFVLIASGIGLRQASRNLGLSLRCSELKYRKIARHLRRLNLNLRGPCRRGRSCSSMSLRRTKVAATAGL